MRSGVYDVLSKMVLHVDAGTPLSELQVQVRQQRATHVAIFSKEQCVGVAKSNIVDRESDEAKYRELAESNSCKIVSESVSVEELGRVFEDATIEAQVVQNELGDFVGIVTRQSLLGALLKERREAEESLRASETTSRALLEGSPVCTKIIDLDFRLQYMSCAGREQLKISEIEPMYGILFPPDLYPEVWRDPVRGYLERAKAGEICSLECPVLDTEGNEVWFDTTFVPARDENGRVQYLIVTSVNVTKRRQAEEDSRRHQDDLAHVSRISTMGEMATGIAHELNQPLSAIASYSYAAKTLAEPLCSGPHEIHEILGNLEDQAIRAGKIVRRLRDFVNKTDSVRVQVDLNTLVQDVAKFVEQDIS